ncbi:50S ribosomal protein L24 [Candidatus Saccharibacteria bacterium]|nr:50S ribosomal protein L24 [Candidatus Saccharibacteria bacterium]
MRIKKGDSVKVIAGGQKGKDGKVVKVLGDKVFIEKVNVRERHIRPTAANPKGGKKDIHVGLHVSNVALLDGEKTTKVGFKLNDNNQKVRVAKKTRKEIK